MLNYDDKKEKKITATNYWNVFLWGKTNIMVSIYVIQWGGDILENIMNIGADW